MELSERVQASFEESVQVLQKTLEEQGPAIVHSGELMLQSLLEGGKLLSCGNGGSAADAQHLASEMLNRFEQERPGLPAIALTCDAATLTSIANDYHFNDVFAKQIRALGQGGDILLLLTTSGNSANILSAADAAHEQDMRIIALTGRDGGALSSLLEKQDLEIRVPSNSTARIQEAHGLILHCLCDLVDHQLLGS